MSSHNIGFNEDLTKIIFELSSNIIKYAPYFFCRGCNITMQGFNSGQFFLCFFETEFVCIAFSVCHLVHDVENYFFFVNC